MKATFTCSLDEDVIIRIRKHAREGKFRNKSHLVEEAIRSFLEERCS